MKERMNDTIMTPLYYIICVILVILGFVADIGSTLGAALVVIGGLGLWFGIKNGAKIEKTREANNAIALVKCSYDEKSKTLFVEERSPEFRKLFDIRKHEVKAYEYVKPSYVYTGATVGGVTTGGVHKQGDYYKQSDYTTNYELIWIQTQTPVEFIGLSKELFDIAQKSKISKYLDRDYLDRGRIRVVDEVKPSQEFTSAMAMGITDLGLTLQERDKAAAYPTESKCEAIISWLSTI